MKKSISTILSMLLCLFIIAVPLTACKVDEADSSVTTQVTEEQSTEPTATPEEEKGLEDYEDVMKISCLVTGYYGGPDNGTENELHKYLLDTYKIDFSDWEWITGDSGLQKASMYVASGTMPDTMIFGPEAAFKTRAKQIADQVVEAGLALEITQYLDEIPNAMKYLSDDILNAYRSDDGNLYMLPSYTVTAENVTELTVEVVEVLYARTDWLEQLGLEFPVTTDDFYDMLKAFESLPAVGDHEVIPFAPLWNGGAIQSHIGAMFGIWNYRMVPDDEEQRMMDMYETTEYLNYLKYAAKLYREGLIYPETYTTSWEKIYNEMMPGGYVGCGTMWSPNIIDCDSALRNTYPDADYEVIPLPKALGVESTNLAQVNTLGNIYTMFNKDIGDPERLFKLLNWMCGDGWPYIAFGIPAQGSGEWYINDSGATVYDNSGLAQYTAENPKYKQNVLGGWSYGLAGVLKFTPDLIFDEFPALEEHRAAAHELYVNDIYLDPMYDVYMIQEAGPVGQAKNADLTSLYNQSEINIVMTAVDDAAVESMYQQMIEAANTSGRLEVLAEQYATYQIVKEMMGQD